jgi:hypothetical protein
MSVRKFLPVLLVFLLVTIAGPLLRADTLTASLVSSTLTGTPGGTVSFQATLSNTSGTSTFLTSDGISSDPLILVDDTPFVPFFFPTPTSIASGNSLGTIVLFNVMIDPSAVPGSSNSGIFTIYGGIDGNTFIDLADLPFTVDFASSTNVPEPATLPMLLVGLALAGAVSFHKLRFA